MHTLPAVYQELAMALRQRLEVIADRAAYQRDADSHLRRLREASERVVTLEKQLPVPVDPQLAHYLQRCSYDKALAWLESSNSTE